MLKNRTVRIVISLLASLGLWIYVVGSVNPSFTKVIRNVPVSLTHTVELEERGLAVSGMSLETVDVEVSGPRSIIGDLEAGDMSARVDMATATKGENEMPIKVVGVLTGIEVNSTSASNVTVNVEDLTQKEVDVTVEYEGELAEGAAGTTVEITYPKVIVSGAESLVDMVKSAKGIIDAGSLTETLTEIDCALQPVNEDGTPVAGINVSHANVGVKSILSITKGFAPKVSVVDESNDGLIRTTEVPEEIHVFGRADAVNSIKNLEIDEVVVTGITEDREIPMTINLPEGVALAEQSVDPKLLLKVVQSASKKLSYTQDEIEIKNREDGAEYTFPQDTEVTITLTDSEEAIKSISKTSLMLYIDATKLTEGSNQAEILWEGIESIYDIEITPGTIGISVRK